MTKRETREIAIGAVTALILAGAFAFISGRSELSAESVAGHYRLKALFNRVDGLLPGDEVQLSGIRVGTVEDQALDDAYHAVLTLTIRDEVKLPEDTSAAIHTTGLFGSKYVVLEPGGSFDYLEDGDTISYTQDALVVEDLLELIISEGKANRKRREEEATGDAG